MVILSLASAAIGLATVLFFPSLFEAFLGYLKSSFENILGDISKKTAFELAIAIFRQNLTATLMDLFGGAVVGLFPIISLAFNFFAVGFLSGPFIHPSAFPEHGGSFQKFFLSIAPHGLFEFPALILSSAFGMRLGLDWLLPASSGRRKEVFKRDLVDVFKIIPLVVALLVIAAFVESFITATLVR